MSDATQVNGAPRPAARHTLWKVLVRAALILAILATPLVVVSATLAWKMHASLTGCLPYDSDEVHYWNEINCFVRAGLSGGYCVDNDQPARATWTRFGPHGPGFPIVYGVPALVFGWHQWSGPVFNLVAFALATAFWVCWTKPNSATLAVGTLLVGSFWPLMLYVPTTMQEPLHFSIAMVLAGLGHRVLGTPSRGHIPFLAVVAIAAIIKFSWILVLVPWACIAVIDTRWRTRFLIVVGSFCGVLASIWVFTRICSPYPDRLTTEIDMFKQDPNLCFWTMVLRWQREWGNLLDPKLVAPIGLLQRYEILAIALTGAALLVFRKYPRAGAFAAINVMIVLIPTMLIFYMASFRDYRMMAPPVLLSLLLLLRADWRLALPFVIANIACVGIFIAQFEEHHRDQVDSDPAEIAAVSEELRPYVTFAPGAGGWTNTFLFPVRQTDSRLLAVPAGVGITFALDNVRGVVEKPRSRYVILPRGFRPPHDTRLKLLTQTSLGPLYANPDCPDLSRGSPQLSPRPDSPR
jgi:hypothetical protein